MLKRFGKEELSERQEIHPISACSFPAPFSQGLEYSSPARGTWNIVHTGMLIPESHQIFVCAKGCLRGVVLTAAEMNAMDRYSAIEILPENVLDGSIETLMIRGVADILNKLPYRPKVILLFISCQHFFLAYDQNYVFQTLRETYPDLTFIDGYMIPTLRKSGITPDQKMRVQMYSALQPVSEEEKERSVNLIGSNLVPDTDGEFYREIKDCGYRVKALNFCKTYEDYKDMAKSRKNLVTEPLGIRSAEELKKRLGQEYLYLPQVFCFSQIEENYTNLRRFLGGSSAEALQEQRLTVKEKIKTVRKKLEGISLVIDAAFTFRILNLTRFLIEEGFRVKRIYADAFLPEEKEDFEWLKEHCPDLEVYPISRPLMRRVLADREEEILALGQKGAYFTGTRHFINMAEGGGLFGYQGVSTLMDLLLDAKEKEKDPEAFIQKKGFGCESCI